MLYKTLELRKTFKERTVLNLENLTIEKEKIYALIGANGAGKTTLLNILAFLDTPTTGQLHFYERAVQYNNSQLLELRRRVVLVDQYPILFTGPVWKNVEFGLKVRGVSKAERKKRIEKVLRLVGMENFILADAHKLSGGEGKRVALARALAIEPEVLLCDEPTANVDAENQEIILNILKTINRENKTSIILATHYLSQIRQVADHTLMLEHGCLSNKAKENIYRCQRMSRRGETLLCHLNDHVSLSIPYEQQQKIQRNSTVHINPHMVRICQKRVETLHENTLTGYVTRIEQDNSLIRLTIACGITLHLVLKVEEYKELQPMIGEEKAVTIPDEALSISE
ncbi:MAG: energy-coupling factor ABC transporter ATP-binding protein [Desulfocapsa sp.]|nr:energy-coupling factor ABC transporter ATP-binding protein [Desulfocapsa sp.]